MLRVNKTVGIIGLGLLGGSLAMALKAYTDYECVGYARRQEICDQALADGCVSQAWTNVDELITHSDIVVFALPPETNAHLFEEKAHLFKTGQIVTDVSSAKDEFAAAVYEHIPDEVSFVSIHPMAPKKGAMKWPPRIYSKRWVGLSLMIQSKRLMILLLLISWQLWVRAWVHGWNESPLKTMTTVLPRSPICLMLWPLLLRR